MINIEDLAKEMFERFASNSGTIAKWEYLSRDRQKVWIQDVTLIADRLLLEIRKDVKPPTPMKHKADTSYALGYKDGRKEEKILFITLLQQYHEDLMRDYADFLAEE